MLQLQGNSDGIKELSGCWNLSKLHKSECTACPWFNVYIKAQLYETQNGHRNLSTAVLMLHLSIKRQLFNCF